MIDLNKELTLAQIAFALMIMASAVVWRFFIKLPPKSFSKEKGQIAVLVLLVSVVGLTIGLSVASRTITGLKQEASLEATNRAFSAAEAGIEEALSKLRQLTPGAPFPTGLLTPAGIPLEGGSSLYQIEQTGGGGSAYQVTGLSKDDTVEIKLDGSVGQLQIQWTTPSSSAHTALGIFTVTADGAIGEKYGLVCNETDEGIFRGFLRVDPCLKNFSFGNTPSRVLLRARFMCDPSESSCTSTASTDLTIQPGSGYSLPAQSYKVSSTGSAAGTERSVEVSESLPSLPAIFDFVLFSKTTLQQ